MQSEVGCTKSSLKQPVRHAASIAVMVILPIIRLTAQFEMLRVDAQGIVAAMSSDVIKACDRLRVDAQDEAGSGCLAPPEAGLLKPTKQGQNDLRTPIL